MSLSSRLALLTITCAVAASPSPPHIILVALDDYGWADSWHSPAGSNESVIPTLRELVATGIDLQRHYVFMYCSPSRSALHTGRNPIHVNVLNSYLDIHNPADPVGGYQGVPLNMTFLPQKLKQAGYATHFVGKSHMGMATPAHIPTSRGYDTSLHYFTGANDYWTSASPGESQCTEVFTDLWQSDGPGVGLNNSWACSQTNQAGACVYEDEIFTRSIVSTINASDASTPFFAYVAFHNVHEPLEVPQATLDKFAWIDFADRRKYMAMVHEMDAHLGRIVAALKAKGMWENTLLLAFADNGGPLNTCSNFPLAGGKMGNMEGGTRGAAVLSGGVVPPALRGTASEGFIAIEDWWATLLGLAGVDAADAPAAAAGLPPPDSIDQWPFLSGQNATPPRTEIWKAWASGDGPRTGAAAMQGFTNASSGWHLLIDDVQVHCWSGPYSPNASASCDGSAALACGRPDAPSRAGKRGCLFNVLDDPGQHTDAADAHPDIVAALYARLREVNGTAYNPDRGTFDARACDAYRAWGGFYGPFLPTP
jgi:arylsulfatase B